MPRKEDKNKETVIFGSRNLALEINISSSKINKISKELEENGYFFEKAKKHNARIYTLDNIELIKQINKKIEEGLELNEAIKESLSNESEKENVKSRTEKEILEELLIEVKEIKNNNSKKALFWWQKKK